MEEFYIDSDGIKLHAKLDKPEGVDKGPLCILIHGFTGHMEEEHLLAAKDAFLDLGMMVLRVEMYGHGMSGGVFKYHTMYKWVSNPIDVVRHAKSLDYVTELYFAGHSQGGLLTMLMGGMFPDDFKMIIPMSPAWMIPKISREGMILGTTFDPDHIPEKIISWDTELSGDYIRVAQTIHVEDSIKRYKGPVLLIHGVEDEVVPYSYAEEAAGLYKNASLIGIQGADHCYVGHNDELADAIKCNICTIMERN